MSGKFNNFLDDLKKGSSRSHGSGFDWEHNCAAAGCPLKPSAIKEGQHLCSYHLGHDPGNGARFWQAITRSIQDNYEILKRVAALRRKTGDYWTKKNMLVLQQWKDCPMGQDEPPSYYITRVNRWIEQKILSEAQDLIERGQL